MQASDITVNTEQATVQGVLTAEQIDKLPVDGRNFLDLAQLEPGVQMQDGADVRPDEGRLFLGFDQRCLRPHTTNRTRRTWISPTKRSAPQRKISD